MFGWIRTAAKMIVDYEECLKAAYPKKLLFKINLIRKEEQEQLERLREIQKGIVKCRRCWGNVAVVVFKKGTNQIRYCAYCSSVRSKSLVNGHGYAKELIELIFVPSFHG